MNVKDLRPNTAIPEIELEIVSLGEAREFATAKGAGKVANAAGKDSKGDEIKISLWNDQIDQVAEGQKIRIENGWASEYKGQVQISTGKKGTLTIVE